MTTSERVAARRALHGVGGGAVLQKITHPSAAGAGVPPGLLLRRSCSGAMLSKASWFVLSDDSLVV